VIYVAIWFDKQETHERAFELACKHTLGFFEASSSGGEIWLPGNGTELVLSSKHQEKPPKPITDPRIAALVRSYRPGGAVVYLPAYAENPRRRVVLVYISRDLIGLDPPLPLRGNLAQLESALTESGIVYAVVDEGQQRAFARDLQDGFRAARQPQS
jgi:hypothetical protein